MSEPEQESTERTQAPAPGADPPSLKRVLSFPWLLLYGLGSTVGAGIYVLIGVVAERAGSLAPWSFFVASLLAVFSALSFAELSKRFPKAGGALVYVEEGFANRGLSIAVGIGSASAGAISAAAVSRGFVSYLSDLVQIREAYALSFVVIGVGLIAAWGVKESIVAASIVTLIEVGGLLAVLLLGGVHLATSGPDGLVATIPSGAPTTSLLPIFASAVVCFYAFLGFEDMVNVAEEVRDVRRAMPRAILWTLAISTTLYVLLAAIAVRIVPAAELGAADAPLSLVFERSGGPSELLSAIALIAMLNGALVQVIMSSRILFSLARDGSLPSWLAKVNPRTRTPIRATALVIAAIGCLVATLPLSELAAATASVALAVFTLVNLSLVAILLRERRETGECRSRLPIAVPALGAGFSVVFLLVELFGQISATH